jgi:hypothetical protein
MPITTTNTQVTWSAANTKSITSATQVTSDVMTLDSSCVVLSIQLTADNAGTPAAGDVVIWRIMWSTGDVFANSGDDYDTGEHAAFIALLDTFGTNVPGEDPAVTTVQVTPLATKFKLAATAPLAATRNITVSARIQEIRAS